MLDYTGLFDAHQAQLGKAAGRFATPADDFARHLRLAARRIDTRWPRLQRGTLTLTAGVAQYPAPADCSAVIRHDWGRFHPDAPWDETGPGVRPLMQRIDDSGTPMLWITPAPRPVQLQCWGSDLIYWYYTPHLITDIQVTVDEQHRAKVLLAALIEALRELSTETAVVQLQRGLAGIPTAGTPAYLYEAALREWGTGA